MEGDCVRVYDQRVVGRVRQSMVKPVSGGVVAQPRALGDISSFVEYNQINGSFEDMDRFAFVEMFVWSHVGIVGMDDKHFVKFSVDVFMGA